MSDEEKSKFLNKLSKDVGVTTLLLPNWVGNIGTVLLSPSFLIGVGTSGALILVIAKMKYTLRNDYTKKLPGSPDPNSNEKDINVNPTETHTPSTGFNNVPLTVEKTD